jgi:uncharacterized protein YuzE
MNSIIWPVYTTKKNIGCVPIPFLNKEVDALYIRLQEKYVARTLEIEEGLNLDLDEEGKLIGLEVLDATERYTLSDIFNISTENLILEEKMIEQAG